MLQFSLGSTSYAPTSKVKKKKWGPPCCVYIHGLCLCYWNTKSLAPCVVPTAIRKKNTGAIFCKNKFKITHLKKKNQLQKRKRNTIFVFQHTSHYTLPILCDKYSPSLQGTQIKPKVPEPEACESRSSSKSLFLYVTFLRKKKSTAKYSTPCPLSHRNGG